MQGGSHESVPQITEPFWEGGVYENTYFREDGVWKIGVLDYHAFYYAPYDQGWGRVKPGYAVPAFSTTFPEDPTGPDELRPKKAALLAEDGCGALPLCPPRDGEAAEVKSIREEISWRVSWPARQRSLRVRAADSARRSRWGWRRRARPSR